MSRLGVFAELATPSKQLLAQYSVLKEMLCGKYQIMYVTFFRNYLQNMFWLIKFNLHVELLTTYLVSNAIYTKEYISILICET